MARDRVSPHWVFSFAFVGTFMLYLVVLSLNFIFYSPLKRIDKQRFQQMFVLQKLFQVEKFMVNSLFWHRPKLVSICPLLLFLILVLHVSMWCYFLVDVGACRKWSEGGLIGTVLQLQILLEVFRTFLSIQRSGVLWGALQHGKSLGDCCKASKNKQPQKIYHYFMVWEALKVICALSLVFEALIKNEVRVQQREAKYWFLFFLTQLLHGASPSGKSCSKQTLTLTNRHVHDLIVLVYIKEQDGKNWRLLAEQRELKA